MKFFLYHFLLSLLIIIYLLTLSSCTTNRKLSDGPSLPDDAVEIPLLGHETKTQVQL